MTTYTISSSPVTTSTLASQAPDPELLDADIVPDEAEPLADEEPVKTDPVPDEEESSK